MCGRYVITNPILKTNNIVKTNIKVVDIDNYNAHPTQKLPVIKSYTNGKALELCEWGLVPAWSKKMEKSPDLVKSMLKDDVPLEKFGTPEDVANLVVWLSSDLSNFVTGSVMTSDGGQTRS